MTEFQAKPSTFKGGPTIDDDTLPARPPVSSQGRASASSMKRIRRAISSHSTSSLSSANSTVTLTPSHIIATSSSVSAILKISFAQDPNKLIVLLNSTPNESEKISFSPGSKSRGKDVEFTLYSAAGQFEAECGMKLPSAGNGKGNRTLKEGPNSVALGSVVVCVNVVVGTATEEEDQMQTPVQAKYQDLHKDNLLSPPISHEQPEEGQEMLVDLHDFNSQLSVGGNRWVNEFDYSQSNANDLSSGGNSSNSDDAADFSDASVSSDFTSHAPQQQQHDRDGQGQGHGHHLSASVDPLELPQLSEPAVKKKNLRHRLFRKAAPADGTAAAGGAEQSLAAGISSAPLYFVRKGKSLGSKAFSRGTRRSRKSSISPESVSPASSGGAVTTTAAASTTSSSANSTAGSTPVIRPQLETAKSSSSNRIRLPKRKPKKKDNAYDFDSSDSVLGIVLLEINKATQLPKIRNMTRLGWDMDPFTVISFGRRVFRTRVLRHNLNPVWNEKLYFHVRRGELGYQLVLTVLDWDSISGNDFVGDAKLDLSKLIELAPQANSKTGLFPEHAQSEMTEFSVPLNVPPKSATQAQPMITYRAKYTPYAALRQRFWRQYLKNYDTDDTNCISRLELSIMLDSLGSTLRSATINSFWEQLKKNPDTDELSLDEAVIALEGALHRPESEKRVAMVSTDVTPAMSPRMTPRTEDLSDIEHLQIGKPLSEPLSFSGWVDPASSQPSSAAIIASIKASIPSDKNPSSIKKLVSSSQSSSAAVSPSSTPRRFSFLRRKSSPDSNFATINRVDSGHSKDSGSSNNHLRSSASEAELEIEVDDSGDECSTPQTTLEKIINIKTCPLCHKSRLNRKAEKDIITHLAVCASADWSRIDRMAISNYVTPAQAQRKFISKVLSKFTAGAYNIGANSANILVQDRVSGQLQEEKMQIYVRLGIRMLYKGARSQMEGPRARRLLRSMTVKQGQKYNSTASAKGIPAFIAFHKLDLTEVRDPISSFKTFNEFFYRKLKEDARPIASPNDPNVLTSPADCRMMAFQTITQATEVWIKGHQFTMGKLLGEKLRHLAPNYENGSMAIFRLAPQDYHRYHCPVDGIAGEFVDISGEYYTVNPQAVRSPIDIYGNNVRQVIPFQSSQFGTVMAVQVGAMMVSSIKTSIKPGETVKRGQEYGWFEFGASTILLIFEPNIVQFDSDLLENAKSSLETLVRMGTNIGVSVRRRGSLTGL